MHAENSSGFGAGGFAATRSQPIEEPANNKLALYATISLRMETSG
jgi:hypothetical protein